MIYLKSYKLFESDQLFNTGKLNNQFLKTKKEINDWLHIFGKFENLIINEDLTVDASLIDLI